MKKIMFMLSAASLIAACNKSDLKNESDAHVTEERDFNLSTISNTTTPKYYRTFMEQGVVEPDNEYNCLTAPGICDKTIVVYVPYKLMFSEFIGSVNDRSYRSWLTDKTNFNTMIEIYPEYKTYFEGARDGTKSIVQLPTTAENVYPILFGKYGDVNYGNHEASIVITM